MQTIGLRRLGAEAKRSSGFAALTLFAWLIVPSVILADADSTLAQPTEISFPRQVKPILARRCFACHGPNTQESGLRLDSRDAALKELDSGAHAVVPGKADESELIARVTNDDEAMRMPPEGKPLTPAEIETLRAWIAAGAPWQKHWAFIPPKEQPPPAVKNVQWGANEIDRFILARLEAEKLQPAPTADRRTLARRAYFDLTGLPPTEAELRDFLDDKSPDAWPKLIDRLLASPHYGEQWARHWLDVVRFAETNSFERDGPKPNAWKYRDYVVRSFNDDKPYDQFVREQLAGDELDDVTVETMTATGYYRLGTWDDEPADPLQARYDDWDDIVSTTSQAFLGLTVGCARCHDHKIDPIPQRDYYGMLAFFADVTPFADVNERDYARYSQWDASSPEQRAKRQELRKNEDDIRAELTAMEEIGIARMQTADQDVSRTPDRQRLLSDKLQQYLNINEWELYQATKKRYEQARDQRQRMPKPDSVLALAVCNAHPEPTHVLQRGNPHAPGDEVQPHFPELFGAATPTIPATSADARSAGRRRVLAEWIASPVNLLTARVIVNRVWQHHFGHGIVRSANNFGELGDAPTHPELLDWLALWLIKHDWKLKPLHRLIMTSSAYRMASTADGPTAQEALARDPTNDLLWRFDMRRLTAEEIRDAVLVASGRFNPKVYGRSMYPPLSKEVLATQSRPGDGWGESSPKEQSRRSLYIYVKRSLLTPQLTAFDFPDVDSSCEARFVTTQPGQALTMLNGAFANEQAGYLADRVIAEAGTNPKTQVSRAIEIALNRRPTDQEIDEGLALMKKLGEEHGQSPRDVLRLWCLAVLNLNEFVYLD
jgi:mono/diheme cytochrome c family protein